MINSKNFKSYRDKAIELRREEIKNNVVEEKLKDFTIEYIEGIQTVRAIINLFRERPDWKKRHKIAAKNIKSANLSDYKKLALQSKREDMMQIPVNDNFKPIISKINHDEDKILKVGTTEDIKNVELPQVPDIAITPMKELKLSEAPFVPKKIVLKILSNPT